MCLQLVCVHKTHVWYLALTREGSQGVREVSPPGHASSLTLLNETKRIWARDRLAVELTASKQGVKLSFTSPFSPLQDRR